MATFKKVLSVLLAVVMAFSVFSVAASAVTTGGTDSLATLTLGTDKLTVDPGDEIVVTAYLTTNFYAASYTIPWFYSKNIFTPVSAEYAEGSPFADYAKLQYNANLNTNLVKNQFGTKTLAWTANPVLAANGLTAADITKDNFQNYFYYATSTITPNSQIGPQAAIFDNNAIVNYTFKVADDAAPGTVGVIWFDQCYGWSKTNTGGIFKIACYKDGAGQVGTTTTACYTDVSTDASRLVFTVAGTAEPEEPKAADYAAVEAAKAKIPADLSIYTDDTVATLNAAVAAVEEGLTADRQAEVDAWAAAIEAAITGLELKPVAADYSKVTAAIAKVPADLSIYTNGDAVTAAVNAVDYTLTDKDQATVDAYAAAIEAAIAALELKPADYTAVEAAKAKIPADLSIYTDESVARLNAALEAVVYDGITIHQQQVVIDWAAAIEAAIAALELKPADYTAVEAAKAKIPADLTIYTDDTVAVLNRAVAAVVEGLDITKQADVNAMAAAIEAAIAALEIKEVIDYAAPVRDALAKVPADLTIYTDETAENLNKVVDLVKATLDYIDDQAEADSYVVLIEDAIRGLELKPADYTAVEAAKAKIPADLTIYTDDTVATLNAAVEAVVYGLDITAQDKVNAMAAEIETAIAALELKPVAPVDTNVINAEAVEGGYKVVVKNSPEKVQFVGEGTTRTYTRESDAVVITTAEDGTEIWTIAIVLPRADFEVIARYNKVWDAEGYKFSTIVPLDEAFYSAEAAVEGYAATYTVKTGLDIKKIQIVDNGSAMTLASGYEDIDGVRVWTIERAVTKGAHEVAVNYKTAEGWKTADSAINFTATLAESK